MGHFTKLWCLGLLYICLYYSMVELLTSFVVKYLIRCVAEYGTSFIILSCICVIQLLFHIMTIVVLFTTLL